MRFKLGIILMVMFLSAYPVIELTRCIVKYNIIPIQRAQAANIPIFWLGNWIPTLDSLYLELALIWGFWLVIPVLLWVAIKKSRTD